MKPRGVHTATNGRVSGAKTRPRRIVLTLTAEELAALEHAAVDAGHGARLGAYVSAILREALNGRPVTIAGERAATVTAR